MLPSPTSSANSGSRFARLADRYDPPIDPFSLDPDRWVREKLAETLWSLQRTIADSVRDNRYTAVHSCHDAGKSHLAARIAAWWIDAHPPGEAFVVSTAPTFAQVRAILWRYIGQAHRKGGLVGKVNQTEWHIGPEIVGYGRKPADYDPAAFQGIHARWVLVLIDEACGVPEAIWNAVDALVTNEDSRVLAIGNPDDPTSYFAKVCKPGSGWNVIHIDGLATPNFTGEVVPLAVSRVLLSPTWVEERKTRWGENSPLYIAKVRGLFPEDAEDTVVPLSWANRCRNRDPGHPTVDGMLPVELGFDVGAGGDLAVIQERRGMTAGRTWRTNTRDPEELVRWAVAIIDDTRPTTVKIDEIGIGWGIMGGLRTELARDGHHPATITGINVGRSALDTTLFPKLRDQMWWQVGRELSEPVDCTCGADPRHGTWDLTAIDDDTVAQLTAPKYTIDASGRVKVEPKEETRKRIGRSPDDADALLLAYMTIPPVVDEVLEYHDGVEVSPY